jgi:signal transduction histidine kinase/Tfp pilus assembly protein PilF
MNCTPRFDIVDTSPFQPFEALRFPVLRFSSPGSQNWYGAWLVHLAVFAVLGGVVVQTPLAAQNVTVDSLTRVLATLPEDTNRVNSLIRLSRELWLVDSDLSIRYAKQAIQLSQQLGYVKGEANANNSAGAAYRNRGDAEQALNYHRRALALREHLGDRNGVQSSLNNIGVAYQAKGEYDRALDYYLRSLSLAEQIRDTNGITIAYLNIGDAYLFQGEFAKALDYQRKALILSERASDKSTRATIFNNIGEILSKQGNDEGALDYFNRALVEMESLGERQSIAGVLSNIGHIYAKRGQRDAAFDAYRKSLALQAEAGNKPGLAAAFVNVGSLYLDMQKLDSAERYLQQGMGLALETKAREAELASLTELMRLDSARGNIASAFARFKQMTLLRDSLFGAERTKQLAALQERFTAEKQEQQISLLEKEKTLQTTIRNAVIVAFVIVCIAAAFVTNGYFTNKRKNEALTEANAEITRQKEILEEQARSIQLKNTELQQANMEYEFTLDQVHQLNELLRQQNSDLEELNAETMRQQVALENQAIEIEMANNALQEKNAELEYVNGEKNEFLGIAAHDLKNPLASIIMASSTVRRYADKMTQADILSSASNIEETAKAMNQIIMNLLDTNAIESGKLKVDVEEIDIGDLVGDVVNKYEARAREKHIAMQYTLQMGTVVQGDMSMAMQVLDNLVSNAVKYSPRGKNITVSVVSDPIAVSGWQRRAGKPPSENVVLVAVQDEGPGLSEEDKKKLFGKFARLSARPTGGEHSTGLGLSIVKKLAEAMGGSVWCESELGHGATFILQLPTASHDAEPNEAEFHPA